jgi:hypothetical protein
MLDSQSRHAMPFVRARLPHNIRRQGIPPDATRKRLDLPLLARAIVPMRGGMDDDDHDRQRRLVTARRTGYLGEEDVPLMATPDEIGLRSSIISSSPTWAWKPLDEFGSCRVPK